MYIVTITHKGKQWVAQQGGGSKPDCLQDLREYAISIICNYMGLIEYQYVDDYNIKHLWEDEAVLVKFFETGYSTEEDSVVEEMNMQEIKHDGEPL